MGELTREEAREIIGQWWAPIAAHVNRTADIDWPEDDLEEEIREWAEAQSNERGDEQPGDRS